MRLQFNAILVGACLLTGCAQLPRQSVIPAEQPVVYVQAPQAQNGAIFQAAGFNPLFEDRRPRQVGDTLTVQLDEQVSASKSSDSTANRKGAGTFTPSVVPQKIAGLTQYGLEVEGTSDFTGGGSSNARNSFTGTITVTVTQVLPNGNLIVRGEKHIGINQGTEYIRFFGNVNPRTISAQNTVNSSQVADSRIEYVGDGYINEAQSMGWMQRILLNISPF